MIKKFKCIKKYPGGPDIGQILVSKMDFKGNYHIADFNPGGFPKYFELIVDNEVKYSLEDIENAVRSFNWGPFTFSDLKNALNKK